MSHCLIGKTAIVTGSSRGIGCASALALAEAGADITVCFLREKEKAAETVSAIQQLGSKAFAVQADVRVYDGAEKIVAETLRRFGKIDVLVNNVGVTRDRTLLKMTLDEWTAVIETNLTGVFHCCKAVLKHMVARRKGRIINVSSVIGETGGFGQSNYAAAKAGIGGFTKSLAREVASKGITVNAVSPGFIDTDMTRNLSVEIRSEILRRIPMGRFGKPEEVAELIVFLASDRASYVTGQTFHVNGGLYA